MRYLDSEIDGTTAQLFKQLSADLQDVTAENASSVNRRNPVNVSYRPVLARRPPRLESSCKKLPV